MEQKYYYQVLISTPDKDILVFWIKNEEIKHNNPVELKLYVKKNLPIINEFRKVKNVFVKVIDKEEYNAIDNWYIKNSKKRDYRIVND